MIVNELYKKDDNVYRVLSIDKDKILVINCNKNNLPYLIDCNDIGNVETITEEELKNILNIEFIKYENMTQSQKNKVNNIFGTFCAVLSHLKNYEVRGKLIKANAELNNVSAATIRNRLISYLIFQDIGILLPRNISKNKSMLSEDEINFKWALNKYYYQPIKLSLKETYRRLIKDKYLDLEGNIKKTIPTFRQFTYYYSKNVKQENLLISREGKGDFMRNKRALLGNGVRELCNTIGYGMFDSTICDIYLVNDLGEVVGRPIMAACVDGYSSLCMGYWLGYEGGVISLRGLINNICCNKVEFCKKFNIDINEKEWNCDKLPYKFITDKGREYVSETFSQLTELGIQILNLPPYRPELKSRVEKFFDIIQKLFKKDLASRGVIFPDFQERGGIDYRKKACLTLEQFERILILCIIHYNNGRLIELPYDMIGKVKPFASDLWNYCLEHNKNNLIDIDKKVINLTLLSRTIGKFRRDGFIVNKLRYRNYDYVDRFLKGGEAIAAYKENDVSKVWLFENNEYVEFDLIDNFFANKTFQEAEELIKNKDLYKKQFELKSIQSNINLTKNITNIINTIPKKKVILKNIRKNRKNEIKGDNL